MAEKQIRRQSKERNAFSYLSLGKKSSDLVYLHLNIFFVPDIVLGAENIMVIQSKNICLSGLELVIQCRKLLLVKILI